MLIVDAQAHIWAANTPERPWPARHQPQKPEPVTKDDLLREMAAASVDCAVLVPPSWEGERNDIVLAAAHAHPNRFAVMGRIDPEAPASRRLIATWLTQHRMLGLRFSFGHALHQPLLTEGRIDWLWQQAEQLAIPIMMSVPHALASVVDRIAERHPELRLVIDHLGLTQGKDETAFRDLDRLLALAKRRNVAVKVSGLPFFTTDDYPYRRLHPDLRRTYDTFGPQRMFWGSDLSRVPCTYRQSVTMFTEEMPWLSPRDLEWIMGRGLCEWIGWKL
jgi:predicted TIM-barrel fold metal-dependent hydrolase